MSAGCRNNIKIRCTYLVVDKGLFHDTTCAMRTICMDCAQCEDVPLSDVIRWISNRNILSTIFNMTWMCVTTFILSALHHIEHRAKMADSCCKHNIYSQFVVLAWIFLKQNKKVRTFIFYAFWVQCYVSFVPLLISIISLVNLQNSVTIIHNLQYYLGQIDTGLM